MVVICVNVLSLCVNITSNIAAACSKSTIMLMTIITHSDYDNGLAGNDN